MKTVKVNKAAKRKANVKRSASICFCAAIALVVITYIMNLPEIRKSLQDVYTWFERIENYIAGYDKLAAFGIIMALFSVKSVLAFIPFSVLFISSGMVFSAPVAMGVSVLGFVLIISVKFFWGKKFGGGNAHKLAVKSKSVTRFMDFKGKGNKWMLVVLRFVPFVPVGTVSRAYGATEMKYLPFVGLSVLGFLPRVVLWSFVGTNIFDPFTPTFMAPIIVLLIISGISLKIWDAVLD
ncbi:MAG: TVP38/TMEM64 family protein [Clostridia bacterium]|nr:TVP38/TMEM64 family protein [Clostridia bacterium]